MSGVHASKEVRAGSLGPGDQNENPRLTDVGSEDGYGTGDRILRTRPVSQESEMGAARTAWKGARVPAFSEKVSLKARWHKSNARLANHMRPGVVAWGENRG